MQEVVDLGGGEVAVERAAQRVDRAVGAGEEAQPGLTGLERGLEPHVAARRHARVAAGAIQTLAAHEPHAGVGEGRGQPRDRVGGEERVGVREHQHLAARGGDAAVERGRLAGAWLLAHEPHAIVGVALHERVGGVGRAVGDHDRLEPGVRIALAPQRAGELGRDAAGLVVGGHDHRDVWCVPALRFGRDTAARQREQQQGVADPRVAEQGRGRPEDDGEGVHAASLRRSTPAVSR